MEDINEKLSKFSAMVLRDANEERERLIEETEDKYKSVIDEKENEYLKEAYNVIQKSKTESKRESGEELLHAEMDSKKKLLKKREEIIDSVVDRVKERLEGFTKSDGYGEWLIRRAKEAFSEVGGGEKVIYVSDADMRYKSMLEGIGGDSKITVTGAADNAFMGGVRVYNADRRVAADYSFKELLAEEKQSFLQNSGLSIR